MTNFKKIVLNVVNYFKNEKENGNSPGSIQEMVKKSRGVSLRIVQEIICKKKHNIILKNTKPKKPKTEDEEKCKKGTKCDL